MVFMIAAVVYLFGAVVYWFWASGEVQPWAQNNSAAMNENKSKVPDAATYVGYTNEALEIE